MSKNNKGFDYNNSLGDNRFHQQFKKTFDAFFIEPQTMKELSIKTGIDRANICRFCRTLRINRKIAVVKKAYCSITKRLVNKYTTNPDLFPNHSEPQLKLF